MGDPEQPDGDAWMWHMRAGDFARAWEISDAVLRLRSGAPGWHLPRHEQALWDGTPIDGRRVLVRCYHGLGDTIQFARYLPLLRQRAAHVLLWAQPSLIPLLRTIDAGLEILPLHDGDPAVAYDVDVEIMELADVFRSTLATLPGRVPYIHVEPATLPDTPAPRVGLVWRAGDWAEHRSIPFASSARWSGCRLTGLSCRAIPGSPSGPRGSAPWRGSATWWSWRA